MHKKIVLVFLFPLMLLAQNSQKTCDLFLKIDNLFYNEHFHYKPVDDSLSVFVFDTFVNDLDPQRNIFTQKEYQNLSRFRFEIDDFLLQENCGFMNDFEETYKKAIQRKKMVLEKIHAETLNYDTNDTIRFSKKSFPFDLQENDLERVCRKRIRYDVLSEISEISNNLDSLSQNFESIEKPIRLKNYEDNLCTVANILSSKSGLFTDLQTKFLDIFCQYFDPHSNYFTPDAKSSFMSGLSTSNLTLGLFVDLNEKNELEIVEIVTGGPAFKSKKIEIGDIITKVANQKGEEYQVSCGALEKIAQLIFADANAIIGLTIKKKNGTLIDIILKKQLMKATENEVYSFIIENNLKMGYINIPSFYADFENNSGQGCANDVAREIVKLQKENIKGIVIDLQNNGGGSIDEAIKLAGMFVNPGPISILADGYQNQTVLHNPIIGTIYNGPIVIIINGNSASASEFFSAAMQDYQRAILIGSPTLGKATMQTILPLDQNNDHDFVKVTTQKFYRITGDSNQIKGIIPDIVLPVLFDSIVQREKNYKTALAYDQIIPKSNFVAFSNINFSKIIKISSLRLAKNPRFQKIIELNSKINAFYSTLKKPIPLQFKSIFADVHQSDALFDQVKKTNNIETICKIYNHSFNQSKLKKDSFQKEINDLEINNLQKNPYLEEASFIINDLVGFKKEN